MRELFVRELDILISVYYTYGRDYQKRQTLAEFLADALRGVTPNVMQKYLNQE